MLRGYPFPSSLPCLLWTLSFSVTPHLPVPQLIPAPKIFPVPLICWLIFPCIFPNSLGLESSLEMSLICDHFILCFSLIRQWSPSRQKSCTFIFISPGPWTPNTRKCFIQVCWINFQFLYSWFQNPTSYYPIFFNPPPSSFYQALWCNFSFNYLFQWFFQGQSTTHDQIILDSKPPRTCMLQINNK